MIILRIEIPSRGIEVKQTKKFRRAATIREVLELCKASLKPCFHDYPFHLFTKTGERLPDTSTIEQCGLQELQELYMKPENEADVEQLLLRDTPKRPASESTVIHQQFVKSGFLYMRRRHTGLSVSARKKKRWCVLKESCIYFFESPKDKEATGFFDLDHCSITFFGEDDDDSGDPPSTTSSKKKRDSKVVFQIATPENVKYVLWAESEAEAKSWYQAVASRSSTDTAVHAQRVKNASVSGYAVRKARGSGAQRKYAVLLGTTLFLSESPADQAAAEPLELFSTKIVHYDDRREISITSFGEEGFVLAFAVDAEYAEWVRVLRQALGAFVSSGVEELAVDLTTEVVKAGYMLKKKANRRFSSSKKRWFVLKRNKLYYCALHTDTQPLGCLDLLHTQANFYILDEDQDPSSRSKNARLELVTTGGVYILRHPEACEAELRAWCEAIKEHCVGIPFNVVHKQHVDFDYKWTGGSGEDPVSLFEFADKIGEGAYASVHRAHHRDTGFELAIKILKIKESAAVTLKQEIDVLKQCRSPQIVTYFGTVTVPGQLWILTELASCGSIKDIMKVTLETLNEPQLAFIVTETLKGLYYLHSSRIIHHDIKAGNILLTEEAQVKLADFGVSQQFQTTENIQADNFIGSPLYMSPEVLRKSVYNHKTDVWSLGITVIEMAEGSPPNFGVTSFAQLLQRHEQAPPKLAQTSQWSPDINDFIKSCLNMDAEDRPDTVELLSHPFLRQNGGPNSMKALVAECLRQRPRPPPKPRKDAAAAPSPSIAPPPPPPVAPAQQQQQQQQPARSPLLAPATEPRPPSSPGMQPRRPLEPPRSMSLQRLGSPQRPSK